MVKEPKSQLIPKAARAEPNARWPMVPLGEIGRWFGGGTPSKSNPRYWTDGTIPWVSPKDMKQPFINDAQDYITEAAVEESSTNMVEVGSVLVVARSGILRHTLPVAITTRRVALNQDIKAIQPRKDVIPRFLALALKAFEREILHTCTKTGTTVQSLELPVLQRFQIPLPPTTEQRRIVAEIEKQFTRLDAGVAALRRTQANLKRYRAAVLKAACEGHLFSTDLSTWIRLEVSAIGEAITGNTPPTGDSENLGSEVPFFKPTDLDAGYNVHSARQYLSAKGVKHARVLPVGAVLVTCIGATIGKTGFARVPCATNQQINALVADSKIVLPEWVFWVFSGPDLQQQIKDNASATTLPILNKSKFQALRLPIPPLAEQKRIVAEVERRLSMIDDFETAVSENLVRSARLRQSILHQALASSF